MTDQEAHGQAFENGRKVGDAEGYARGLKDAYAAAGDLISRKALLDVIAETADGLRDADQQNAAWALSKYTARDIQAAPAVNAEPVKHGWWVPDMELFDADEAVGIRGGLYQTGWKCSLCGRTEPSKEPYCHCGADMRGESDA